jgi:hypothetical protein
MKVGDKVLVRKPAKQESPFWFSGMDKYDGTIQEVSEVVGNRIKIKSDALCFYLSKWLTPVIGHQGKYYRTAEKGDIGSQVMVSDYSKANALNLSCSLTLQEINLAEHPFEAGGEKWKYALVEVKEKLADESEKDDMDKYPPPTEAIEKTLEGYLEDEGIWCDTYEEKYALLSYLGDRGYRWNSGKTIHEYNWKRTQESGEVWAEGKRLLHQGSRKNHISFSTFPEYAEIMAKYGFTKKAETPTEKSTQTFAETLAKHKGPTWPMEAPKGGTITFNSAVQVELDNNPTQYQKVLEKLQNGAFVTHLAEGPLTIDETGVKYQKKVCYNGIDCWVTSGGQAIQYDPLKFSYISDGKSSESEKKMTKPSMFVVNTLIRPSESCPLPLIVNYLDSKGYTDPGGGPLGYSGNLICIQRNKKATILTITSRSGRYISEFAEYEEIISPAANAAKPQKENKMALFSLASKKVRSLAYGALNWAFISPLKRTFKPVATIAQFSVCYLTLAAAGYFAYGLYQNPQSVVEWISELSPVEIRLKNSEE